MADTVLRVRVTRFRFALGWVFLLLGGLGMAACIWYGCSRELKRGPYCLVATAMAASAALFAGGLSGTIVVLMQKELAPGTQASVQATGALAFFVVVNRPEDVGEAPDGAPPAPRSSSGPSDDRMDRIIE